MTRPAPGWRWQDSGMMDITHPVRRSGVASHDIRWIGLNDLFLFARGASVLDVGCNRGHVGYEFARSEARLVHGCDIDAPSMQAARFWFAELPYVESKFEVVDLTKGAAALDKAFGPEGYDIVLFIGVQHKLKRVMKPQQLDDLISDLGTRALTYLGWNGYTEDLEQMDRALKKAGLLRIHTSEIPGPGRPAAIWARTHGET